MRSCSHPSSFQGEYSCKIHNVKKSTVVRRELSSSSPAKYDSTSQILCNYALHSFFFYSAGGR